MGGGHDVSVVNPSVADSNVDCECDCTGAIGVGGKGRAGVGGGNMLLVLVAGLIIAASPLVNGLCTDTSSAPVWEGGKERSKLARGEDDDDVCEESMLPGRVRRLDEALDSSFVGDDGNIGISNKGTEMV